MKHILTLLTIMVLSVGMVSAQTGDSKRKSRTTTTTTTTQQQSKTKSTAKQKQQAQSKTKQQSSSSRNNSANSSTNSSSRNNSANSSSSSSSRNSSSSNSTSSSNSSRQRILNELASNMVYVSGGTFTMGATSEQGSDAYDSEKPVHSVYVSSFYICKYEVTQELWQAIMGSNPSYFKGDRKPVEEVSWNDCKSFISKLNSLTGKLYRLPTEAEWEYACRGGNRSQGYKYSGSNNLSSVAWYTDNSGSTTHEVGQKSPNELGIYDMSGNVWEWCSDLYDEYNSSPQTNPTGASSGSNRVERGGSWCYNARICRSSRRCSFTPGYRGINLGLRLALSE